MKETKSIENYRQHNEIGMCCLRKIKTDYKYKCSDREIVSRFLCTFVMKIIILEEGYNYSSQNILFSPYIKIAILNYLRMRISNAVQQSCKYLHRRTKPGAEVYSVWPACCYMSFFHLNHTFFYYS